MKNLKIIFFTLSIAGLFSCNEPAKVSVEVGNSNGGNYDDLVKDDTTDRLTVPNQTTGTYLTMFCKWESKSPTGSTTPSTSLCRVEDSGTKEKYRGALTWEAKVGDTSIWKKSETLPYSTSIYSARVSFESGYENVTIEATLPEFDKSLKVKVSMYNFQLLPAYVDGDEVLAPESNIAWKDTREGFDDFLSPSAFCTPTGEYHKNSIGLPWVDYSKITSGVGAFGKYCGFGIGEFGDYLNGLLSKDENNSSSDFAGLCKYHKKVIKTDQPSIDISNEYCKIKYKEHPMTPVCSVLTLLKKTDYNAAVSSSPNAGVKVSYRTIVFAMTEIQEKTYKDAQGIPMGKLEIQSYINTIPDCGF